MPFKQKPKGDEEGPWLSGKSSVAMQIFPAGPDKTKTQVLTFQKRLEGWNLLQLDDIGIVADVP